jgi:hypothetical protein
MNDTWYLHSHTSVLSSHLTSKALSHRAKSPRRDALRWYIDQENADRVVWMHIDGKKPQICRLADEIIWTFDCDLGMATEYLSNDGEM